MRMRRKRKSYKFTKLIFLDAKVNVTALFWEFTSASSTNFLMDGQYGTDRRGRRELNPCPHDVFVGVRVLQATRAAVVKQPEFHPLQLNQRRWLLKPSIIFSTVTRNGLDRTRGSMVCWRMLRTLRSIVLSSLPAWNTLLFTRINYSRIHLLLIQPEFCMWQDVSHFGKIILAESRTVKSEF